MPPRSRVVVILGTLAMLTLVASACGQAPTVTSPPRPTEPRTSVQGPPDAATMLAVEIYPRLARAANALDDREVWDRTPEARVDFGEARNRCSSALPALQAAASGEKETARRQHLIVAACQKLDQARAEPGDVEQVLALLDLALLPPGEPLPRAVPRGPK